MTDDLDHRIVDSLVSDGRKSFVKIAEELDVSEATVRQRVARLTADMQITAVTNPLLIGYDAVCMLGLRVDKAQLQAAADALTALDEVTYLIASTGRFDYLAEITCRNNKHLLDFMHRRLPKVPGVQDSESFGYLSVLKESYRGSA
jgi:Lrp/AsnC family transcriptional regulator for asnA, asnC and gidA